METWAIILIAVAAFIIFSVLSLFVPPMFLAKKKYFDLLVRTSKDKWQRQCSWPQDEEQSRMYVLGTEWAESHKENKKDVDIFSGKLHLSGEYFDFGFDRAVIIVPGRMEACGYSYYFSDPYYKSGYNVLVIDNRAHGLSDGKYNSLGKKEHKDVIEWAKLLHDTLGNKEIIIHGICIGSSTAAYALSSKDCPDYIVGMVADGMYRKFFDTFINHLPKKNFMMTIFSLDFMLFLRLYAGVDPITDGPYKTVKKITKPILFIHSKEDTFSEPAKGYALYESCPSKTKKFVWFEHGRHSHLRITDTEKYDATIKEFVEEVYDK